MRLLKSSLVAVLLACIAQVAVAEEVYADVEAGLLAVHPAGSVTTVDKANDALSGVDKYRFLAEARYTSAQRTCYDKFFVQYCLDKAKEDYRVTIKAIEQVEIEANRFKRQARADESEERLKARNAQRQSNQP